MEELQRRKRNIKPEEFLQMEGLLSLDELTTTLFESLKGGSALGWDGFTVNWLRTFWEDLSELVTRALNEMYDINELSGICRRVLIKLLIKGDKSPLLPGNYHPISLLSVFYKLDQTCSSKIDW